MAIGIKRYSHFMRRNTRLSGKILIGMFFALSPDQIIGGHVSPSSPGFGAYMYGVHTCGIRRDDSLWQRRGNRVLCIAYIIDQPCAGVMIAPRWLTVRLRAVVSCTFRCRRRRYATCCAYCIFLRIKMVNADSCSHRQWPIHDLIDQFDKTDPWPTCNAMWNFRETF